MKDYEKELDIDPDALDVEWMEQPGKYLGWCQAENNAAAAVRDLKEEIEYAEAGYILKVAKNPKLVGVEKPTRDQVGAYITLRPTIQKLRKQLRQAEHDHSNLRSASFAFTQRKSALEELVRLGGRDYFAAPSAPRDLAQEVSERRTANRRKTKPKRKSSMNRKKKPTKRTSNGS